MLSKEQILKLLDTLHEHTMAKDILVPTLKAMGLKGVKFTGGGDEHGIDIEYYETTQPENRKSFVGMQVKKQSLTYSAGGAKNSVKEVKNQAEEAFDKEIHDLETHSVTSISRFIVATLGEINEPARKYIGRARLSGKARGIDYWEGDRIAEYIQKHWLCNFTEYFKTGLNAGEAEETSERSTIVDAEYILDNYEDEVAICNKVRKTISTSDWEIVYSILSLESRHDSHTFELSDLLLEMECGQSAIEDELLSLRNLGYLEIEGGSVSLTGKANNFSSLLSSILEELADAEEYDSDPLAIFDELIV